MDKYKRFYGIGLFIAVAVISTYLAYNLIAPKVNELTSITSRLEKAENDLRKKRSDKLNVEKKLKALQNASSAVQKKIYSPVESDLGNDSLFFAMYNDVIEMIHANSVKIKSINYEYSPKDDKFVISGKDYFVCDVNLELVANYTNIGKLIEELYQYPYYIKFNKLEVKPYPKDKKILIVNMGLRLYANTEPEE